MANAPAKKAAIKKAVTTTRRTPQTSEKSVVPGKLDPKETISEAFALIARHSIHDQGEILGNLILQLRKSHENMTEDAYNTYVDKDKARQTLNGMVDRACNATMKDAVNQAPGYETKISRG